MNRSRTIISLCVFTALFIGFMAIFLTYNLQQYVIQHNTAKFVNDEGELVLMKDFFEQDIDTNEKRIFIFGSSHVMALNPTAIHNYLQNNNFGYNVYNFAEAGDSLIRRLNTIDKMIAAKPEIVVYGVSYRDFKNPITPESQFMNKPTALLPDPSQIFDNISTLAPSDKLEFVRNPKLVTMTAINYALEIVGIDTPDRFYVPFPNAFFKIRETYTEILSTDELKHRFEKISDQFYGISSPQNNKNALALKEIIDKLHKNNIKVIIFITPQSRYFLDDLSESDKQTLNFILQSIASQYDLEIYSLEEKYADLNIWRNPTHVAINENITVYNDDISEIILKEIKS